MKVNVASHHKVKINYSSSFEEKHCIKHQMSNFADQDGKHAELYTTVTPFPTNNT
jgi:hypothetical protein